MRLARALALQMVLALAAPLPILIPSSTVLRVQVLLLAYQRIGAFARVAP
jgi:hypothetical protein